MRAARGALLGSVASFGLISGSALAQDADPAASPPAAQDDNTVGEIVVTAQRREERLQQVPLSVTALSGDDIREQDISDVSRLAQVVPGLRLGRSGAAERPAIRGVYTEAIGLNSDPRIGFYIDEIYQARPQQASATLVDLERVEVQKGPQGTLFGRNSYGGNISLSTAKPTDRFEGGFDLIYGNYDRVRAEGFVNVPITEGLALRVAGEVERHDGYLKSIVSKSADLQDKKEYYLRGTLRWAPPSLDDRLEVFLRGSYYVRDDNGFNSVNGKVIGVAVDPALVTAPGGTVVFNGQSYTFPGAANGTGGFNGLNPGTGTLYPFTNAFRDGIADVNGADVGIPLPGPYKSVYDAKPYEDLEQQQYSGVINFQVSPDILLRSITSYTKFRTVNGGDGDGGPIPLQYFVNGTRSKVFTQELQLQSTGDGPFQYTIGGYYLSETGRDGSSYYYLNRTYSTATAAAQGLPVLYGAIGGYGAANGCQFSYTTPAACNLNFTTGNIFDSRSLAQASTKSYAVYGQASYTIADKLTITAGARYTIDDKQYRTIAQAPTNGTLFAGQYAAAQGFANPNNYYAVNPFYSDTFANLTCGGFTPQPISTNQSSTPVATVPNYFYTLCGDRKFKFGTYRVAVDYQLTPDNMLYASYSTGRHSGGFGAGALAANSPGLITTFDSEGVRAFEIGSKNQFFDRRLQLNFTAFLNLYSDLQAQGTQAVIINGVSQNVTTIFNTGSQRAPGAEVSMIAKPVPGLTLNASVNYLRARYKDYPTFVPANFICFYISQPSCGAGSFPPTAPQNYGVGGGYFPNAQTNPEDFVLTGINNFSYAYIPKDRRVQNTPDWSAQFGASYDIDLGSGGTLTPQFNTMWSGRYLLSPAAPNIEQKSYFKTDARITWVDRNGNLSIQAFVQNLENKATLGRITVSANGQIQGTYDDPRTYGVRLGYRF
jgi:iron complex outermembrane receptor protein